MLPESLNGIVRDADVDQHPRSVEDPVELPRRARHDAAFRSRALSARWAMTFAHAFEQYTASARRFLERVAAVRPGTLPLRRHRLPTIRAYLRGALHGPSVSR